MRNMSPVKRTVETELAQKSKFMEERQEGNTPKRLLINFLFKTPT